MGSVKRKSSEEGKEDYQTPPTKQQRENNSTDEPVACLHDVSYPEGYVHRPSSSSLVNEEHSKPPKEFPFTLDPFQLEAIKCLDNGESVMVSAHTSAGKTVVALYAIAMSLRNKQRVIYTSPIKALSNQKYREFKEEFSDVGLMTGDVTIDPNASCLVMTTEIWRSMQYKGSEVTREVAWIIFDEVHYMRDRERGVVWEESIVMAPKNSRFVFLSATVPNAKEFADWVAKVPVHVHQQPCHIVYTDYRPTPLQHYMFPSGGDGLYLAVDEKGKFREDSFHKALNALVPANEDKRKENGKWQKGVVLGKAGEDSDIFKMVKMIIMRQYDPVICFSFSKRECEFLAMQMAKMDLNNDDEKVNIETIFWSAMDMLSDDDKKLPQVSNMLPLLKRGIGVHHSGLLPILKEVIEILFQEGFIKCLFATETFSIGLNMPAKTVVFTNVRKFDGDKFRWITSGEYIQMSGRAGRRGIDERGICILMVDEKLEPSTAKLMLKGSADPLNSAFHLSYNMLLNQIRSEDGDPENLLRNSFFQFQADRAIPDLEKQAKLLEEERNSIIIEEEDSLENYYSLLEQYKALKKDVRDIVMSPKYCLPFLQPGRLISVQCTTNDENSSSFSMKDEVTWGVIINFERIKVASEDDANKKPEDASYTVDVLTRCRVHKDDIAKKTMRILPLKEPGEPAVITIPISQAKSLPALYSQISIHGLCCYCMHCIDSLSSIRLVIPKDLLPLEARENTLKKVSEVLNRFAKEGMPRLDPEDDMKVQSSSYRKATRRIEALENLFEKHEISKSPLIEQQLKVLHMKKELTAKIKSIKRTMKSSSVLAFKDELKSRKRVLRRLGYISSGDVVELKGKVACEISSADELTLTELMFNGVLKDVNVEEMVSLLSCFVWQEKLKEAQKPREELDLLFTQLQDTAHVMEAVYAWARGSKFYEIMEMTPVFEGSLIRAIRRLEEVLQQLIEAAKSIGETDLEAKFEDAVSKIKRDIVFAASLYL
ncbi:superkiller viralicidic activity 2-like 2 [Phtheirospermum japonicum]|uniref:RNA helicase n=1 Tax=Phtheirospermum japonicum TaxID=374723 RepID=A0A830CA20_9LAMI|nr:superkiller viralicidic activity 2-like 2 [Phtheirospermum japonicum]